MLENKHKEQYLKNQLQCTKCDELISVNHINYSGFFVCKKCNICLCNSCGNSSTDNPHYYHNEYENPKDKYSKPIKILYYEFYVCKFCKREFYDNGIRSFIDSDNNDTNPYQLHKNIVTHMKSEHKIFFCPICNKILNNKEDQLSHLFDSEHCLNSMISDHHGQLLILILKLLRSRNTSKSSHFKRSSITKKHNHKRSNKK